MFGGLTPTIREFEVTGTFTTGMYDYDTRNIYTTFDAASEPSSPACGAKPKPSALLHGELRSAT